MIFVSGRFLVLFLQYGVDLKRCGEDAPSQRAVSGLALSRQGRVSKSPFPEVPSENPTAEPIFPAPAADMMTLIVP